jgi:hypothetical protein
MILPDKMTLSANNAGRSGGGPQATDVLETIGPVSAAVGCG